ncbi:hypothetical protein GCM10010260_84080 [Streptomyces filipinensis]|uniref:Uncharacterized protein n=1 Tax=Streptomyces filipinensis TaxID=66887 RepID=A0A918MFQ2_9ACTN|nr:hypothetical protein GCM10010260_84080 [Streptomyces filipinensis]
MTMTAPVADARILGLAHYAARGVLEHVLARHGLTFTQQIALRAAVTADAPQTPHDLITQIHAPSRPIPPTSAPLSTNCWQGSCSPQTARGTFTPRTPGANYLPLLALTLPP